jgi:hypothetical protein
MFIFLFFLASNQSQRDAIIIEDPSKNQDQNPVGMTLFIVFGCFYAIPMGF